MATPLDTTPTVPVDPRKLQKRLIRTNIEELLLKFKKKDLIGDDILGLFEVTKDEVFDHLSELRLTASKKSIVGLLSNRAQDFSVKELQDCYTLLQLYRVAFNESKVWKSVRLLEPVENLEIDDDLRIIERNILQAFRIKGLNAVVKIITHEDLVWMMIIEKKLTRKKGVKHLPPVFICYEVGTPYMFLGSPVPQYVMDCLLKAMQYTRQKPYQLQGRNIKSLLAILKNKATHRANTELVVFQPGGVEIGEHTTNYSDRKAYENYANALFNTEEPIYLNEFKATADVVWRPNNLVPSMEGKPIVASVQLKSKNIIEMIKYAIVNNIVATPLPEYVQTILRSGKTKVNMRI